MATAQWSCLGGSHNPKVSLPLLYSNNTKRTSATRAAPVGSVAASFLAHMSFTEVFQVEVGHVGAVRDLGQGK